jgi:cellobiose phosphorylase
MQPGFSAAPRQPRRAPAVAVPSPAAEAETTRELEFFNGHGGFAEQGREYLVNGTGGLSTPAPWINVIANREFGFQVSSDGAGFTWARNSRENTLTPWSNDPVSDRPGEAIYLRDEESGELWSPTPAPIRHEHAQYSCAHGFGYSRFTQRSHGVALELTLLAAPSDPVKVCRLVVRNESARQRSLSVTSYLEWVLAPAHRTSSPSGIRTARCWRAIRGTPPSRASPSPTSAGARTNGPATAANFSDATERSTRRSRWCRARRSVRAPAPRSIPAQHCAAASSSRPARALIS